MIGLDHSTRTARELFDATTAIHGDRSDPGELWTGRDRRKACCCGARCVLLNDRGVLHEGGGSSSPRSRRSRATSRACSACARTGEHAFEGDALRRSPGASVTWSSSRSRPPTTRRWKPWRLDRAADAARRSSGCAPSTHARGQLRAVGKLLRDRRFAAVINACDAGREGELIFRYVYQHARQPAAGPAAVDLVADRRRDPRAASRALAAGARATTRSRDAARSRSEADWLVGMNATRAVTARGRDGRAATRCTRSAACRRRRWRCSSSASRRSALRPARLLGGARHFATAAARVHGALAQRAASRGSRRAALADAVVARDRAAGAPPVGRARSSVEDDVREPPPQLFDLTSLQRTANRRFGLSARAHARDRAGALRAAQGRSRTRAPTRATCRATSPASCRRCSRRSPQLPEYARVRAAARRARRRARPRAFVDDSKVRDHHAIIPTGDARRAALDRDEARALRSGRAPLPRRVLSRRRDRADRGVDPRRAPATGCRRRQPAPADTASTILDALPAPPDRYLARGRVRARRRLAGGRRDRRLTARGARARAAAIDGATTPSRPRRCRRSSRASRSPARSPRARSRPRRRRATPRRRCSARWSRPGKAIDDEALRAAMKDTGLGTPATRAAIIETLLRARLHRARAAAPRRRRATGIGADREALPVASLASPELTGAWEARLAADRARRGLARRVHGGHRALRRRDRRRDPRRRATAAARAGHAPRVAGGTGRAGTRGPRASGCAIEADSARLLAPPAPLAIARRGPHRARARRLPRPRARRVAGDPRPRATAASAPPTAARVPALQRRAR